MTLTSETITDYETVEKERELYYCEHCNEAYEDELELDEIHVHEDHPHRKTLDSESSQPEEVKYLCPDCSGLQDAIEIREKNNRVRSFAEGIATFTGKVIASPILIFSAIAVTAVSVSAIYTDVEISNNLINFAISFGLWLFATGWISMSLAKNF